MRDSLEFLLGLLDADPAGVAAEDLDGPHGGAVRLWQRMGFVAEEPLVNPRATCPSCGEGVPYRLGDRLLCDTCRSTVDPRHLQVWPFRMARFLSWLASELRLRGGVRQVDVALWQIGARDVFGARHELFFRGAAPLGDTGRVRLAAYRNAVELTATPQQPDGPGGTAPRLCLLELLSLDRTLSVADPVALLGGGGSVRFEEHSGALFAGGKLLGEVPAGSKEHAFLAGLAGRLDQFVPYAELKRVVLSYTGSSDETEEATFCQGLKSRIKKKWIPEIDRLVVTTNKGDGYRMRKIVDF